MEFYIDDKLEELFKDMVLRKTVKPEFGNKKHIELVKYLARKDEYYEWVKAEGLTEYNVEIEYYIDDEERDTDVEDYDVLGRDAKDASENAIKEFESEHGRRTTIVDITVYEDGNYVNSF